MGIELFKCFGYLSPGSAEAQIPQFIPTGSAGAHQMLSFLCVYGTGCQALGCQWVTERPETFLFCPC